jgi:hypothetical protein
MTREMYGCQVTIKAQVADVLISPLGHVFVDSWEKTLRPITPATTQRILHSLRYAPEATTELLDRVEKIAECIFVGADPECDWIWELDADSAHHICPQCGN